MHVNIKRVAVATVLCGGVAALAFGGEAVSTAFTQSSTSHVSVAAASVGVVQTGDLTLANALPGDPSNSVTVGYDNTNGTVKEDLSLSTANAKGNLNPADIDVLVNGNDIGNLGQFSGGSVNMGTVDKGQNYTFTVQLMLSKKATVADAGQTYDVDYTITSTAHK